MADADEAEPLPDTALARIEQRSSEHVVSTRLELELELLASGRAPVVRAAASRMASGILADQERRLSRAEGRCAELEATVSSLSTKATLLRERIRGIRHFVALNETLAVGGMASIALARLVADALGAGLLIALGICAAAVSLVLKIMLARPRDDEK